MALSIFDVQQERAKQAFDFVIAVKDSTKNKKQEERKKAMKKYASVVKKMPMMIKINGLSYALSFAYSKRKEVGYQWILRQIYDWLHYEGLKTLEDRWQEPEAIGETPEKDQKAVTLIYTLLNLADRRKLMQTTEEVTKLFSWLKRFVGED